MMNFSLLFQGLRTGAIVLLLSAVASMQAHAAGGEDIEIERQSWVFSGITGQYDKAQLQRGFKVYREVCASCHGLSRVRFRNLYEPGGPEFSVEGVKALAAEWPNQIIDGPNDDGEMFERAPLTSDPILGPFRNEKAARAANNGAYPLDLSLITKARAVGNNQSWPLHILQMAHDIVTGYQEGGSDYLYALLTSYEHAPKYKVGPGEKLEQVPHGDAIDDSDELKPGFVACASIDKANPTLKTCNKLSDGMNYNASFPGHQIAMLAPLGENAMLVSYLEDGQKAPAGLSVPPTSLEQNAKDVTAFLSWTADPSLNARKQIGWQVLVYLLITTVLLFLGKKIIWSRLKT